MRFPKLEEEDLPPDRRFGRVFAVIFMAVAVYGFFVGWPTVAVICCGLAVICGALAQFRPGLLNKPNRAWALFGLVLGKIVGTFVLGVIFLVLITPIALFFRLTGRDELRLKRSSAASYWRSRKDSPPTSFQDQF